MKTLKTYFCYYEKLSVLFSSLPITSAKLFSARFFQISLALFFGFTVANSSSNLIAQDSASSGMTSRAFNFVEFRKEAVQADLSSWRELNRKIDYNHPEFGRLPIDSPCENCVEIYSERKRDGRYFIDKEDTRKFYKQTSLGDLHFWDGDYWVSIDHSLKPQDGNQFKSFFHLNSLTINPDEKCVTMEQNEERLTMNNWVLLKRNGTQTSKIFNANWGDFTAGDDGLRIQNIFPGIDAELIVLRGTLKTNFIIRDVSSFGAFDQLIFRDNFALSSGQRTKVLVENETVNQPFVGAFQIYDASNQMLAEYGEAVAYPLENMKNGSISLRYQITDEFADILVDASWINENIDNSFLVIDPIVTGTNTLAQGAILGSMYNASCNFVNSCNYNLTVTAPANATLTNTTFSFSYIAQGICWLEDGAMRVTTGSCISPSNAGFFWFCNTIFGGTCNGNNIAIFNDINACLPASSCAPQDIVFTLQFFRACWGAFGCNNACIGAASPFSVTITGITVEHASVANPITVSSTTVCQGQSISASTSALYGAPPYTYSWSFSPTGLPVIATGQNVNIAFPNTGAVTLYSIVTDNCGEESVASTVINVTPAVVPNFNSVGPFCSGASIPALPTNSLNGIAGTWSPAINNTATTTYTFTPNANQCASPTTLTITITPGEVPTFNPVGPFCSGATMPALPTTSINGINGTWSPAIDNTTTTTYTFSPNAGQCGSTTTLVVEITPQPPAPAVLCYQTAVWNPVTCDWDVTGTQPAQPTLACYETATFNSTSCTWIVSGTQPAQPSVVNCWDVFAFNSTTCSWENIGTQPNLPVIDLGPDQTICNGETVTLSAPAGYSSYLWSNGATTQSITVNQAGTYSVTGTLILPSSTNLVVNPGFDQGNTGFTTSYTVGTGGAWGLVSNGNTYAIVNSPHLAHNHLANCPYQGNMLVANGGNSGNNANVWCQTITVEPNTDYVFSVDAINPHNNAGWGVLPLTLNLMINGNNVSSLTPPQSPNNCAWQTYSSSVWNSGATTSVTICVQNATNTANLLAIDNLSFSPVLTCTQTDAVTITIENTITPTFAPVASICSGAPLAPLPTTSMNGITGTWSPAINNTATTTYTFTPTAGQCAVGTTTTVVITPEPPMPILACYETASFNNTTCAWVVSGTQPVQPTLSCYETASFNSTTCVWEVSGTQPIPTFNQVAPFCAGDPIANLPTTSLNGFAGTWSPALNNTQTTTYTFTPNPGVCAANATMTISIINTEVQISCPPSQGVTCSLSNLPPYNSLAEFIAAGGSATSMGGTIVPSSFSLLSESNNSGVCPNLVVRTYIVEDDCGNSATCTQEISISDNISPTGNAPANVNVQCAALIPAVNVNSLTNVLDNCSVPTVTHLEDVSNNQTCPEIITRTYRITDACGNFTDVVQTITVNDDIAPTGTAPANITVLCFSDVPAPNINSLTNVSDNCSTPTVTFIGDQSNGSSCNQEIVTRTYAITDACGNQTVVTQNITIDITTPSATLGSSNPTACGGSDGEILISGLNAGGNYDISMNGSVANYTANNLGEVVLSGLTQGQYGNFLITPNNCALCSQTINTTITLSDPPNPIVSAGQDTTICEGDMLVLTAYNPDNANITWSGGVQDGQMFIPVSGNTVYTVTAELNNCFSSDQVVVSLNELPNVDAGQAQSICDGSEVTLTATGAASYQWDNGVVNGEPFLQSDSAVLYTVVGFGINGCSNQSQVLVTLYPNNPPSFSISDALICGSFEEVFFTNTSAMNTLSCIWDLGNGEVISNCGTVSTTYNDLGCYDIALEVIYDNGCTSSVTIEDGVCVSPSPIAAFNASPTEQSAGDPIHFVNLSQNANLYLWDMGDGTYHNNLINVAHTYDLQGAYSVTLIAINEFGCSDTTTQIIKIDDPLILYVPNSFTPDGDAFNNDFKPVLSSGFDPYNYELIVFNRWGEIMFVSHNAEVGWGGMYGGKLCPEGVYVWRVRVKNGNGTFEEHRGHVSLLK